MHKSNNDYREKTPKLIFKNSKNTMKTYSKTCSGASQFCTKSLILQLKRNLPKENYYEENGTMKRDLSIETDICILRAYYKARRNKLINCETASTKSKYFANHTEIDTNDEFKYDSSACGDNEESVQLTTAQVNINLTSLLIENLKKLLNEWIKKYLLDNNKTKQKIESVLDSILNNLDMQIKDTPSSCTYTVDIEVIDQKPKLNLKSHSSFFHNTAIGTLQNEQKNNYEKSFLTIPLNGKCLRILSTLSLPKNMYRHNTLKYSWNKLNKIRHKKIVLSVNGSSKYLFTSSGLNFLTIPIKSLTKRCATYEIDFRKNKKHHQNLTLPEEMRDIQNCSETYTAMGHASNNNINDVLNTIPSIYKTIHNEYRRNKKQPSIGNLDTNNDGSGKDSRQNIPKEKCDPLVTVDYVSRSRNFASNTKQEKLNNHKLTTIDKKIKKITTRSKMCNKNISKSRKNENSKSKQFTYMVRKSRSHISRQKKLLRHFLSIFKYFSQQRNGKDIKLDIHVSVIPLSDGKEDKEGINLRKKSYPPISSNVAIPANLKIVNEASQCQNIIPLLDGTVSQSKYITKREPSDRSENINNNNNSHSNNCIMTDSKIAQEISELKLIVKSLATTTEKLVNEHLSKKYISKQTSQPYITSNLDDNKSKKNNNNVENLINLSKGIQISSKITKNEVISGIKLKKDPKKKHNKDYSPLPVKKSTSYNIIDSESILKVTDMTSAAYNVTIEKPTVDKALTCSLPHPKSLFEVSTGADNIKLLALYCNDFPKPEACNVYSNNRNNPCSSYPCQDVKISRISKCNKNKNCIDVTCDSEKNSNCIELIPTEEKCDMCDNNNSSLSICIDIDSKSCEKNLTTGNRGVGFREGCFYCLLLWIPALLISWLFYIYILKDWLNTKNYSLRGLISFNTKKTNRSYFPLTLTDLGF